MHGNISGQKPLKLDQESYTLIDELAAAEARQHFWTFRKAIRPDIIGGWWVYTVAKALQDFVVDMQEGKRPRLALFSPRQHGKSITMLDLIPWVCGLNPALNVIFSSYSERLGIRANLSIQRAMDSTRYNQIFPHTLLPTPGREGNYQRNHNLIEFIGTGGSFRNTTVGGRVTGESLDLGVIDDPIKGREEANSEIIRDKTWEWFTDDFMGCFSDRAGLLVCCTRYHVDDPAGRMIENVPGMKVLRYPAFAEQDEKYRKKGEPLFPELKSKEFLDERRKVLTTAGFMSIYQQSPIVVGGGLFPIEKFKIEKAIPMSDIKRSLRYWDKAGTSGGGAFTAGVLLHQLFDGRIMISDVRRGQWSALEREQRIKQTSEIDGKLFKLYEVVIEQEPGSGGKESAENSIRNLRGFKVTADKVTGDKETRAEPYAAQVQAGNVSLLAADWNRPFLDEHEQFPSGKYKDQVDSAAGSFMKLVGVPRYDSSMRWVTGK